MIFDALRSSTPGWADRSSYARSGCSGFERAGHPLGTQVAVTGPTGPVQTGPPTLIDNSVRQTVAAGAPAGNYAVAWRVISADGHPLREPSTSPHKRQLAPSAAGVQRACICQPGQLNLPRGLANGFAALTLAAGIGAFLWRRSRQTPGEVAMGLISDALINQIRDIAQIEPGPRLRATFTTSSCPKT